MKTRDNSRSSVKSKDQLTSTHVGNLQHSKQHRISQNLIISATIRISLKLTRKLRILANRQVLPRWQPVNAYVCLCTFRPRRGRKGGWIGASQFGMSVTSLIIQSTTGRVLYVGCGPPPRIPVCNSDLSRIITNFQQDPLHTLVYYCYWMGAIAHLMCIL